MPSLWDSHTSLLHKVSPSLQTWPFYLRYLDNGSIYYLDGDLDFWGYCRPGCGEQVVWKPKTTDVDWTSGGCSTREVEPCWTRRALGNINIWSEDLGGTKLWCKHCRFTCAMCKPRTMWLLQAGVCHTYNPPSKSHTDLASRLSGNFWKTDNINIWIVPNLFLEPWAKKHNL